MKAKKKRKKLSIIDKIILILNLILSVSLLLSYLAPTVDPADFWVIALLGFGYQILFLINIVFTIYWLIRLNFFALISLISILIGINAITGIYGFRSNSFKDAKEPADIRMMAYNVNNFNWVDKLDGNPSQTEILRLISEKQPDIINFEEYVARNTDRKSVSNFLQKTLNYKYRYFKCYKYDAANNDSTGNAIYSKFPIVNADTIKAPTFLNMKAIFADIAYKNKVIRVYCIHLTPVKMKGVEKSSILNGNMAFGKSSFIESKLIAAFTQRSHQVSIIKEHLDKCPYPAIIAGDFNDTPISFSVNEIGDGLKNAFTEKGSGFGVTYFNKFPKLQIDYILVSPQFDVRSFLIIDKKLSDHKPVIADLRLTGNLE